MDKVIIFGTYDFLGFSLCLNLLEDGIQIIGYRWNLEENEEFLEEKKFFIGRNANFKEQIVGTEFLLSADKEIEEAIIVISLYDLYYANTKQSIAYADIFNEISEIYNQYPIKKVVCLLPNEYLYDLPILLGEKMNVMKEKGILIQSIYLPTIYGPWQSKTFLFQRYFLKECANVNLVLDKKECTMDAIFINEVVEEIICILNTEERHNIYIESVEEDKWRKGAKFLALEDLIPNYDIKKEKVLQTDLKMVKVMEKISIKEGLEMQKEHLKKLLGHS